MDDTYRQSTMNRTEGTFKVSGGTPETTPARVVVRERASPVVQNNVDQR